MGNSYSHWKRVSGIFGLFVGKSGAEKQAFDENGNLFIGGTQISTDAAELQALIDSLTTVTAVSSTQKACAINGLNVVTGGAGLADATLAAPAPGAICIIRIGSLSGGSVVVTGGTNVKLSGTKVKATFDAVDEALILMYKAANTWEVVANIGGVVLA
ncbi:MAG: hypothetical protein WCQ59_08370 [Candidatus Cloacimonadaceae bacterium]